MVVLTINSCSSSLKFGLYEPEGPRVRALMSGEATGGTLRAADANGSALPDTPLADDIRQLPSDRSASSC